MSAITEALYRHAATIPDKTALWSTGDHLSWSQLSLQVIMLAEWIESRRFHRIAFALDNSIAWIVLDLAAVQAGAAVIPLPTFFSPSQIQHTLQDACVDCFITSHTQKESVGERTGWQRVSVPGYTDLDCFTRHVRQRYPVLSGKVTYTSGSTGEPKGVCLRQSTIDQVSSSIVDVLDSVEISRHLCVLPLATLLENIAGVYAPIIKGVEIAVPAPSDIGVEGGASLDVDRFAKTLESIRPDSIILVPELLVALVTLAQMNIVKPDYLNFVAVGGGRVSGQLLALANQMSIPVFEGYGLSECCSVVTLNTPGSYRPGSVGKPLPHVRARTNATGEIEIRGPVMAGYLGDEQFCDEWYPTGDLGYVDSDGYVFIQGRLRNVFITAYGRNVNPEWVESELAQNPAISRVLLVGEGRSHNLALIWTRFEPSPSDVAEMVARVNEQLPDYARIHHWYLMEEPLSDELVTSNGRMKRDAITKHYRCLIEKHYDKP